MTTDLYVAAVLTAKPASASALRQLLAAALPAIRKEDGCLSYVLHEDAQRTGRFVTYEIWRDDAALDVHLATLQQSAGPTLSAMLEQEIALYRLGMPL